MRQNLPDQRYQRAVPYAQAHCPEDGTIAAPQALHTNLRFFGAGRIEL